MPTFAWNVPLVSLIFLKRSLVFSILLFSSVSLHWSLRKSFLSLLAILRNSAFKWVYLSFSPCLLQLFFYQLFVRPPQTTILPFLCFFFLRMVLIPASCTMSRTSVHSVSGTLSIRSNPLNPLPLYNCKLWFQSYLNGLVVSPTFFNLSLDLAIRSSWSEPQSTPGLVFADCIELLHICWKEYNQSDFGIDHLVMSMCTVFSYVVGRGCLQTSIWQKSSIICDNSQYTGIVRNFLSQIKGIWKSYLMLKYWVLFP